MRRLPALLALLALLVLGACPESPAPPASDALLTPDPAGLAAEGPDSFTVRFSTSRGAFDVRVRRDWSPHGADRLHYLVREGFYDGVRFYRVMDGFMAQFGAHGDTAVGRVWQQLTFPDDAVKHGNTRGTLSFATRGPNTRTTQLFINFVNNAPLDGMGFSPVGEVVEGMAVVDSLYKEYGEGAPRGAGPDQGRIAREGNAYLMREFPKLDSVVTARVTQDWPRR